MIDADVTQRDLAAEIGIAVRGKPYVESQASAWLNGGREMSKEQIMAAERILGVRPGTLTQELGYVPTSAPVARRSSSQAEEARATMTSARSMWC